MTKAKASIEFALICDEIRREDTGKLMVIGVYGANMLVPSFPHSAMFSMLMGVSSTNSDSVQLFVEVHQGRKTIYRGKGAIKFETPGLAVIPLSGLFVLANEATEIEIKAKVEGGRFKSLRKFPIIAQE